MNDSFKTDITDAPEGNDEFLVETETDIEIVDTPDTIDIEGVSPFAASAEEVVPATATAEEVEPEAANCPAWLPLYFRASPKNSVKAMIPPDRGSIRIVARESDGDTSNLALTITQSLGGKSSLVPVTPAAPLDLTPYQNRAVTFSINGIAAGATEASVLCRLDIGKGSTEPVEPEDDTELVWTPVKLPKDATWNYVAYQNGVFVALSGTGTYPNLAYSTDGSTWKSVNLNSGLTWFGIASGGGVFVAVFKLLSENYVLTSINGQTWSYKTVGVLETGADWSSVTYGAGKFVVVGKNSTKVGLSTDNGNTWKIYNLPAKDNWGGIAYGNGRFIAVGEKITAMSTDGIYWDKGSLPEGMVGYKIKYASGKFFLAAKDSLTGAVSVDGVTWESVTFPIAGTSFGMTEGDGRLVMVNSGSDKSAASVDNATWKLATLPISRGWEDVTYGDGKFLAVGSTQTAALGVYKKKEA